MTHRFTATATLTDDTITIDTIGGYIESTFTVPEDYMAIESYVTEKRIEVNDYQRSIADSVLSVTYTCDTLEEAQGIIDEIKVLIAPSTMTFTFSDIVEV
jgi:hypothetical protein